MGSGNGARASGIPVSPVHSFVHSRPHGPFRFFSRLGLSTRNGRRALRRSARADENLVVSDRV